MEVGVFTILRHFWSSYSYGPSELDMRADKSYPIILIIFFNRNHCHCAVVMMSGGGHLTTRMGREANEVRNDMNVALGLIEGFVMPSDILRQSISSLP